MPLRQNQRDITRAYTHTHTHTHARTLCFAKLRKKFATFLGVIFRCLEQEDRLYVYDASQVKRRNDPTSTKVSSILGSYDEARGLVTSSHMIGAILQPATPRPSNNKHHSLGPPTSRPPTSRSHHRQHVDAAPSKRPSESSRRQGVFEQFQQRSSHDDETSGHSSNHVDTGHGQCDARTETKRPAHVNNGRYKPSSSSSSSDTQHHRRLKLAIHSPKVSRSDVGAFHKHTVF